MIAILAIILAVTIIFGVWLDRTVQKLSDRVSELERQGVEKR